MPPLPADPCPGRVGYVLKMYPRFSETFVVTEILARERLGDEIEIFSLRAPADPRFHATLGAVQAPVRYLTLAHKAGDLWHSLQAARSVFAERLDEQLPDLLATDPGTASQALELAVSVRERGITHLHAHFGSVAATVARLAAGLAGVGYSITLHAKDIYHDDVDDTDLETKIRDATHVVTVSDYNLAHLSERFPTVAERLVRVHNGIDLAAFPFDDPGDRPPVVVGVGRLVEKKGFLDLVAAVGRLADEGREVTLQLVGAGDQEALICAEVARLGLGHRVQLLGACTQEETRQRVRAAAVLAAPCLVAADGNRDGLPTTILEALALGTPVVATPVTGIPEAVQDERTGLLVPPADPAALATALGRLLDDAALRQRLARAGRAHVEECFDAARNAEALRQLGTRLPAVAGAR